MSDYDYDFGQEHEFSDADNKVFTRVASATRIAGILNIILGVAVIAVSLRVLQSGSVTGLAVQNLADTLIVLLSAVFGLWMIRAARHLTAITKTKGQDIRLLMGAFYELTKVYRVQFWIYVGVITLVALIVVVAIRVYTIGV